MKTIDVRNLVARYDNAVLTIGSIEGLTPISPLVKAVKLGKIKQVDSLLIDGDASEYFTNLINVDEDCDMIAQYQPSINATLVAKAVY